MDPGFSRRLKRRVSSARDLHTGPVKRFIIAMLNRAILTTAALECGFARVRQWLQPVGKAIATANIGARWFLNELDSVLRRDRGKR